MGQSKQRFRGQAVTIACTELGRSEEFYRGVLGAELLTEDEYGYGCPQYRLGDLVLSLMPNAAERSPATFPDHAMAMLWLEVDDLAAAHEQCLRARVEILQPPDELFMLIVDPDGLVIEVWQAEAEPG